TNYNDHIVFEFPVQSVHQKQPESLYFRILHIHLTHATKYLVQPPCHFFFEASPNAAKTQSYYTHPQTIIPFSLQEPPLLYIVNRSFYQLFTFISANILLFFENTTKRVFIKNFVFFIPNFKTDSSQNIHPMFYPLH